MKIFIIILVSLNLSTSLANNRDLRVKLNNLKKQTVKIHNEILINNKELKKIKIDLDRNTQKKIIINRYIKNKDLLGRRIIFLLQDKFYTNQFTRIVRNLDNSSQELITKQIIREFFLKKVKTGINDYFLNLENLKSIDNELALELENYKNKKKNLKKKLLMLEKKIEEVAKVQKKMKTNKKLQEKAKNLRKKAKNLNDLVKSAETKRKIISKIKSRIKMPVSGEIISDYGEGKDQHNLKNGLVFKVNEDSFVTSPMDGTVVYANKFKSFGNLVMIKDNKGFTSVLIGMRSLLISTGNEVLAGEPIAKISSTLQSQLYFELRENGKIVDPKSKVEIL